MVKYAWKIVFVGELGLRARIAFGIKTFASQKLLTAPFAENIILVTILLALSY